MSPRRKAPDPWPWPADTPTERARRVALSALAELEKVAPERARTFVDRITGMGEPWLRRAIVRYQDDDLLTAAEVADVCGVQPGTVDQWRHRGLRDVDTVDGRRFLMRDVLEYHAARRRRRATVGESG